MTGSPDEPVSDDQLIARLRQGSGPGPSHDPFFDLPMAKEVPVTGDGAYRGSGVRCPASARRKTLGGGYGVAGAEAVRCELEAGHAGAHRAGFSRSHVLHRWHAYEWT